jgi:hypothetical protein
VHAEHDDVGVVGTKLVVGLKDVHEPNGRTDPEPPLLEQEVVPAEYVEHRAKASTGSGCPEIRTNPNPGKTVDVRRILLDERPRLRAERAVNFVRATFRLERRIEWLVALGEHERADFGLDTDLRNQRQLDTADDAAAERELTLLVPSERLRHADGAVRADVLGACREGHGGHQRGGNDPRSDALDRQSQP